MTQNTWHSSSSARLWIGFNNFVNTWSLFWHLCSGKSSNSLAMRFKYDSINGITASWPLSDCVRSKPNERLKGTVAEFYESFFVKHSCYLISYLVLHIKFQTILKREELAFNIEHSELHCISSISKISSWISIENLHFIVEWVGALPVCSICSHL